jgi:hypothetical protein
LGGGGSGDLIFPAPLGGGARLKALGFGVPESPPVRPAAESIPVPPDGLGFTLIRIVSPSYNINHNKVNSFQKESQGHNLSPYKVAQNEVEKNRPLSEL